MTYPPRTNPLYLPAAIRSAWNGVSRPAATHRSRTGRGSPPGGASAARASSWGGGISPLLRRWSNSWSVVVAAGMARPGGDGVRGRGKYRSNFSRGGNDPVGSVGNYDRHNRH